MQTDKTKPEKPGQGQAQKTTEQAVNLNDYAGDEDDDRLAKEQANNYREDVEQKNTGKATTEE